METGSCDLDHFFNLDTDQGRPKLDTGQGRPALAGNEIWVILRALRPVPSDPKSLYRDRRRFTLVYSWHSRVLAGYFDGQLHVQFTRILDFKEYAVIPPEDTPYIDTIDKGKLYDMLNMLAKWSWPIPVATTKEYTARPETNIVPGETFAVQKHTTPTSEELEDGEVVLESLYLSLDPAMRGWLDDRPSYIPPVAIGEIMRGYAVGRVTASRSEKFPVGSYALGMVGWTEQAIINESSLESVPTPDPADGGQLTDFLSVLGLTGITAYWGMVEVGHVKPGDFVVVSGAAGATGSIAGQIAKIHGATVYGIAGSDEKCRWLVEDLKFDGALNYKSEDFAEKFKSLMQGKIDLFYDNVGGEVLDLALLCANKNARFVMCGGVSQYNEQEVKGPKNYMMIWRMRIRMEGFIVFDHMDKKPEIRRKLSQWLAEGRLQRRETIVHGGLSQAETALMQLYKGVNTGKLLVEVKAP
ncbi:hypothetical protein DTO027I6_3153 [Penicillium roqueforti]|uniref:uncharacterized protein n=1 Tax=Penicillium roqueforti TaxID=5082 RepID=UPI00190A13BD|nr:uncharacterized protein LCP9604111_248 [Penicillium roqueforti]KAF9252722.1 hypothetical protein LCP9604111_248 [Penicillium roqueforti]KAI1835772.1 hypothetical protein CBS147337_3795 [Penicillium roqueforti]KAI2675377.1 hypothetical protein CBS147355_6371 [Penicillium roqueforti]KAI2686992.1 hypothetical protein LCP963914a_3593 [Penicillium roqueforti]KAI2712230.1 hypothetical protein CBS147354_8102 [Penicillium roqueforti]